MSAAGGIWLTARRLAAPLTFAPTRRLAALVVALSPVWLLSGSRWGMAVALVAIAAVVGVLLLDVALLPLADDVAVEREIPGTVGVGELMDGRYLVRSHWGRPLRAELHDAMPAPWLSSDDSRVSFALDPGSTAELAFRARGGARGLAVLGPIALRVRTPLGLATRTLRRALHDEVLVAPSLAGVRRFRWLAVHQRLAAVGVRTTRRRGEGRSFARLRDYVPGDDPRHIDWKATAKRGRPMSREFTVEASQTVYVLVDAGRSMTQLAGAHPRFEYALSSALVLADAALTAGDRVGAMVFDDRLRALVPPQRGAPALQALRTALIPVQATLVEPDYATAFRALALRQRKRALVVLLTDVLDARAARTLLAHLTRGAPRHLALVVALRNDALLAAAVPAEPAGPAQLYASAAAAELLVERATAIQRMRDAGVVVLDVAPQAMAAAVVSEYLSLKSRGAL